MKRYKLLLIQTLCIILLCYIIIIISNDFVPKKKHLINSEFNSNLKIILNPKKLCNIENNTKFIFIYVFTSAKNFKRRSLIRKTWANITLFQNIRVAFIIGKSSDLNIEKEIQIEQKQYNDLIQGNFIDSYRNLSYKSLIAWKWIIRHCSNSKFIIKIDDDVVLNTFNLIRFINDESYLFPKLNVLNLKNTFLCKCEKHAPVERNSSSKMYVKKEEYSQKIYGMNQYPQYCAGMGIIMTSDLISRLYYKSKEIKLFWIDDVYVGILGRHIGARFKNVGYLQTNYNQNFNSSLDNILFINDCDSIDKFYFIWNYINDKFNIYYFT